MSRNVSDYAYPILRGKMKERNLAIYRMRVVEMRTFKRIGAEFGISLERARQISEKVGSALARLEWVTSQIEEGKPVTLNLLNMTPRLRRFFENGPGSHFGENVLDMRPADFVRRYPPHLLLKIPNFGRKSLAELIELMEKEEPGVSDIWTAGDR